MNVFVEDRRLGTSAQASLQFRCLHFRQRTAAVPRKPPLLELIPFGQLLDDEGHIF